MAKCTSAIRLELPSQLARGGHSSATFKDRILVFGGRLGNTFFNDLWQFYTATDSWECLSLRAPFAPRANHSCTVVDHSLWVIGGSNQTDVYDDVHVFDLRARTWSSPPLRGRMNLLKRTAHGACCYPLRKDHILLYGGYGSTQPGGDLEWLSDLVLINTLGHEVKALEVSGTVPKGRGYHTWTAVGQRCYAVGGRTTSNRLCQDYELLAVLDVPGRKWVPPAAAPGSRCLEPRSSHTAVALGSELLLVFGGSNSNGRLCDLQCLRPDPHSARPAWQDCTDTLAAAAAAGGRDPPCIRSAHCMEVVGSTLYIISGYSSSKQYVSDIWRVEVVPALPEPAAPTREEDSRARQSGGEAGQWKSARHGKTSAAFAEALGTNKRQRVGSGKTPERDAKKLLGSNALPKAAAAIAAVSPPPARQPAAVPALQPLPAVGSGALQQAGPPAAAAAALQTAAHNGCIPPPVALRLERKVDEVREVVVGQREAETAAVVAAAAAEASKAALQAEVERLRKELAHADSAWNEAVRRQGDLEAELEQERGRHREQLAKLRQEAKEQLERQESQWVRERDALVEARKSSDAAITQLNADLGRQEAHFRNEVVQLESKARNLERRGESLASEVQVLKDAASKANEAASTERQRADQLQERLLEKDRELARVRAQCEEERGAIRQELQAQQSAAEVARAEASSLKQQLSTAEEAKRALQVEQQADKARLQAAEQRAERAERQAMDVQEDLGRLRAENARIKEGLQKQTALSEQQMAVALTAMNVVKAANGAMARLIEPGG